ncbi:hypothetical protein WYI_23580 [Ochrobactrum sp. CDB2]|nr:hypothetical protein WYI_23580 [Ochrobactrum sp. CDB2]
MKAIDISSVILGASMKSISIIGAIVIFSTMAVGNVSADEWWQGSFIKEGSGNCEENDTIRTYSSKKLQGWEYSCNILKQQKIAQLDAVVMNMECNGVDFESNNMKSTELLTKTATGFEIFPSRAKFKSCKSDLSAGKCPINQSKLKSDRRDDGTEQILEFKEGPWDGHATLTGYKYNRAIWTTKALATCSNGSVICRLTFKTRAGKDYQEAYQPLEVDNEPWAVFAELRQNIYLMERDPAYERKAYGGIEVELLNGYQPAADEMIIPENVYKFSECSSADVATK